ncbi:MAG TPA: hypothetical protein VG870_15145 [Chitinophagaceae bacterium]|nr:hypothetical protein [Chitinophagaceae bacterium]
MRTPLLNRMALLLLAASLLNSCKKQTETFTTEPLDDYLPLQVGKYITYRLDSTVFVNFGKVEEIHKYQVRFVIDAEVTDNLGRPGYRVYRYISDSAGTQPWTPDQTLFITPVSNQVELTEDNLRYIKLHLPIKDGFSWKGNHYLPTNPYGPLYSFSNDDAMGDWDFTYNGSPAATESIEDQTYTDVLTVGEDDESYNVPVIDPSSYAARTFSVEKYAKSIGLVYRELIMWEQQPNPTGNPPNVVYDPYRVGFGIRMWMIDHN